ncbi:MAG: metal-dependent hydrolase [Verrucomicrobiae bacterium]|nr:metal-dependent hydrolase [Verrucomicrobiae bacterium]
MVSLADSFVHGLIAVLAIFMTYGRGIISLKELILLVSFAVLIDLDHGIAARSFDLNDWISLPRRPFSHSILFSLAVATIFSLWLSKERKGLYFSLIAITLISHVTRDATYGASTPWNLPFPSVGIQEIPYFVVWIAISIGHDFFPKRK